MFDLVDVDPVILRAMDVMPHGFSFAHGFFVGIVNTSGVVEYDVLYKGVLVKRFTAISEAFKFILK